MCQQGDNKTTSDWHVFAHNVKTRVEVEELFEVKIEDD